MFKLKLFFATTILLLALSSTIAQDKTIRLIVRGDDMGYAHGGNEALITCYKMGIETTIEVLVPSPWFAEAVQLLKENPTVDVGIHLTLTSEWSNIKWRPLTQCPSLKDSNGFFFPMVYPNKNYPGQSVKENAWNIADIEKEFRAQIELGLKNIPRISHISAHMGCTDISEEVKVLAQKLAISYNINIDLQPYNVKYVGYEGPSKTGEEKIQGFTQMLNKLEAGNTYIFVDHPGINNDELKAIHHIGYENVATDRQGVTDLFTNEKVKAFIKEKGIKLISYKELRMN